jgi:hypothetical protein
MLSVTRQPVGSDIVYGNILSEYEDSATKLCASMAIFFTYLWLFSQFFQM